MTRKHSIRSGLNLGYVPLLNLIMEQDQNSKEVFCYIPPFNVIFEHDQGTSSAPTEDAALYQSILRFGTLDSAKAMFRFSELTKWLLHNHKYYVEYYSDSTDKTPYSSRSAHIQDRIKSRIKDLINLGLMCEVGSVPSLKKTDQYTKLYGYTVEGYLLAHLLENTDKARKKILHLIDTLLRTNDSCKLLFISKYYHKCNEAGYFKPIIIDFIQVLQRSSLKNGRELLHSFLGNSNILKYVLARPEVYLGILREVDETTKGLLLSELKIEIETRSSLIYQNDPLFSSSIRKWENMRFQYRSDFSKVVIPGICIPLELESSISWDMLKLMEFEET